MPSELSVALYGVIPTIIVVVLSHYLKKKFSEKSDGLGDVNTVVDIYVKGLEEQRKEIAELKLLVASLRKDFEECSQAMKEHLRSSK